MVLPYVWTLQPWCYLISGLCSHGATLYLDSATMFVPYIWILRPCFYLISGLCGLDIPLRWGEAKEEDGGGHLGGQCRSLRHFVTFCHPALAAIMPLSMFPSKRWMMSENLDFTNPTHFFAAITCKRKKSGMGNKGTQGIFLFIYTVF